MRAHDPAATSASPLPTGHWTADPGRTQIGFVSRTMWGLVPVKGRFTTFDGSIDVRPDGEHVVDLKIDAASVDTKLGMRDKHLRSPDFFHVESHPHITFASTDSSPGPDGTLQVRGTLTVAGRSREITLPVKVLRSTPQEVELETETAVERAHFGVDWGLLGMIRGPAQLKVHAVLTPAA